MIIKTAPPHSHVGKLVAHLQRTDDGNEQVRFVGARGVVADDDLRQALAEMKAISRGSRCEKPLYHVAFNAAPGEQLTPAQWEQALGRFEVAMGLEDRQRAVVQHFKDGRWHTHAVWNRVDPETGLAVSIGRDHFTAKRVARELERELGLTRVADERPEHRKDQQPPERWEAEQARRTKTDAHDVRDRILLSWQLSDNGRTFQHALEGQGLLLARGDERPFVVVDGDGNFYALSGRVLPGERMPGIRAKLKDIEPERLPTVEEAREQLKERELERAQRRKKGEGEGEATRALTPEEAITERYRAAHAALNKEVARVELAAAVRAKKLARAHADEQRHLAEQPKQPVWARLVPRGKKLREREAQRAEQRQAQQERERQEFAAKKDAQLVVLDARRTELRRQEREERERLKAASPVEGFTATARPIVPPPLNSAQETLSTYPKPPTQEERVAAKLAELQAQELERERQRQLRRDRRPGPGRS